MEYVEFKCLKCTTVWDNRKAFSYLPDIEWLGYRCPECKNKNLKKIQTTDKIQK